MPSPAIIDAGDGAPLTVRTGFALRLFYVFALLALASAAIAMAGKWAGQSIAMGGHTDSRTVREIVIGNDIVNAPDNMIRFEKARRDGAAARLDLYVRWPQMDGYSAGASDAFNHVGGERSILFVSFEPRTMSRDMSHRFAPIYSNLIEPESRPGPAGLRIHRFTEASGYVDEVLAVAEEPGAEPFVMRCLAGAAARESLAPCERDIHIGKGLSLSYRMPPELAGEWRAVEAGVRDMAHRFLRAADHR